MLDGVKNTAYRGITRNLLRGVKKEKVWVEVPSGVQGQSPGRSLGPKYAEARDSYWISSCDGWHAPMTPLATAWQHSCIEVGIMHILGQMFHPQCYKICRGETSFLYQYITCMDYCNEMHTFNLCVVMVVMILAITEMLQGSDERNFIEGPHWRTTLSVLNADLLWTVRSCFICCF